MEIIMEQMLLSETQAEKTYIVMEIKDEARLVNRLSSMGIMCGSQIKICMNNKKQPVLVFVRDTLVAIGKSESKKIMVGGIENE